MEYKGGGEGGDNDICRRSGGTRTLNNDSTSRKGRRLKKGVVRCVSRGEGARRKQTHAFCLKGEYVGLGGACAKTKGSVQGVVDYSGKRRKVLGVVCSQRYLMWRQVDHKTQVYVKGKGDCSLALEEASIRDSCDRVGQEKVKTQKCGG